MKSIILWMTMIFVLPTFSLNQVQAQELATDQKAPDFELKDLSGKVHKLSQYIGKIVVLEWTNHTCPFVVKHYEQDTMGKLSKKYTDVIWLTIDSSHYFDHANISDWAQKHQVKTLLDDRDGSVGKRYGAKSTPHMYVIDPAGKIAYQGAIDDDAFFEKAVDQKVNYVDLAIQALQKGQKPAIPYVKQYGCSVKYKQ
jgi:peroxiredoxin